MSGLLTINSCWRGSSRAGFQAQEGSAWQEVQGNCSSGKAQKSRDSSCTGAALGGTSRASCPGQGVVAPTWQIQHVSICYKMMLGIHSTAYTAGMCQTCCLQALFFACDFPRRNMEALHTLYKHMKPSEHFPFWICTTPSQWLYIQHFIMNFADSAWLSFPVKITTQCCFLPTRLSLFVSFGKHECFCCAITDLLTELLALIVCKDPQ